MSKHRKTADPTDADLEGNPLIGGAKGVTASHSMPDDLESAEGATTIEGDTANDLSAHGGIDKREARGRR